MFNQLWQPGKKEIVITIVTTVCLIVSFNGYGSHLFLQLPNGTTVFWQLEPLKR
jgi:hypothetical protein